MIYATVCVGEKWCERFSLDINKFAADNQIHVLTDLPNYFTGCNIHKYTRDEFSYYEKLNLIFNLSLSHKCRVVYIDADCIAHYNPQTQYDRSSLYCNKVFNTSSDFFKSIFSDEYILEANNIVKLIGIKNTINTYIHEELISFPYDNNIHSMKHDVSILQKPLEQLNSRKHISRKLKRYSATGIGYAEGWALTGICIKYNIRFLACDWRKKNMYPI